MSYLEFKTRRIELEETLNSGEVKKKIISQIRFIESSVENE